MMVLVCIPFVMKTHRQRQPLTISLTISNLNSPCKLVKVCKLILELFSHKRVNCLNSALLSSTALGQNFNTILTRRRCAFHCRANLKCDRSSERSVGERTWRVVLRSPQNFAWWHIGAPCVGLAKPLLGKGGAKFRFGWFWCTAAHHSYNVRYCVTL